MRLRERPAAPSRPAVSLLLSPLQVGSVEVRNRIAFTAHGSFLEFYRPGAPADRYVAYEERRARGGVGLIFLQTMHVHPSSHATGHYPYEPDDLRPKLAAMADALHRHDTRVVQQLNHFGAQFRSDGRQGLEPLWGLDDMVSGEGEAAHRMTARRDRGGAGRVRRHGPGVRRGRARRRRAARHARLPAPAVLQPVGQPPRRRVGRAARVRQGARRAGARAHRAGAGRRAADLDRRLHGPGAGRPRPGGAPGGRARAGRHGRARLRQPVGGIADGALRAVDRQLPPPARRVPAARGGDAPRARRARARARGEPDQRAPARGAGARGRRLRPRRDDARPDRGPRPRQQGAGGPADPPLRRREPGLCRPDGRRPADHVLPQPRRRPRGTRRADARPRCPRTCSSSAAGRRA